MEYIKIREGRTEVWVAFDNERFADDLSVLQAAAKALEREVIRVQSNSHRNDNWQPNGNVL